MDVGPNSGKAGDNVIHGNKVPRPTKTQLTSAIAERLNIANPAVSAGSSVDSHFLDAVHVALTGLSTGGADTYRKTEAVLQALGLTYDAYWDTSEAAEKGGGTVTNRAYSRILVTLSATPRCFLLNTNDAPVGAKYESDRETAYGYDDRVTGRGPLNDAGPGSRVIYYSTKRATQNPMHFTAQARIEYIEPGWRGPWQARIVEFTPFDSPIPHSELDLPGWNRQHAITEISWETYQAITGAGAGGDTAIATEPPGDAGGADVAIRILHDFPAHNEPSLSSLVVPEALPTGALIGNDPDTPPYVETEDGALSGPPSPRRSAQDRRRDKLAEQRAVEIATEGLVRDGWSLVRDCQNDGVGYDLLFQRDGRKLKVEVKGIQGPRLIFNVTPKEWWRATTDEAFVVLAVTSVLSPRSYGLHLVTRDRIVGAQRQITGFRIHVAAVDDPCDI